MLKLIKEATEDNIKEITAENNLPMTENEIELNNKACEEAINMLTKRLWDFIADINSVITTLESSYNADRKADVLQILDTILNDSTINIGMLQKIMSIMNDKTAMLIDSGEDKAEKIVSNADSE